MGSRCHDSRNDSYLHRCPKSHRERREHWRFHQWLKGFRRRVVFLNHYPKHLYTIPRRCHSCRTSPVHSVFSALPDELYCQSSGYTSPLHPGYCSPPSITKVPPGTAMNSNLPPLLGSSNSFSALTSNSSIGSASSSKVRVP